MTSVTQVAQTVQRILAEEVEQLAREVGFIQRLRVLSGADFVQSLILGWLQEPEIALAELEKISGKGEKELLKFLKDETGRSESALKKGLNAELEDHLASRFRTACQDSDLWKRVKP